MLKVKPVTRGSCQRMSFGKIDEVMDMPNLIEVQKASYNWFIEKGLKEVFRDMADITDYTGNWVLSFIDYRLDDKPKYSVRECKERDANYAAPMRVTVRLQNKETGVIKESEVYMGDFPIMTDSGTFVINGAERVIVSQLVRSPGVYYGMTHDKTGIELYTSTINPNRGAWLEYETDPNDIFYVRIDKNRKIYITAFVRALGLSSNDDIRRFFGEDAKLEATMEKDETRNTEEALIEVFKKLRPGEPATLEAAQQQFDNLFFDSHKYDISRVGRYKYNKKLSMLNRLPGCVVAEPVISEYTGELIAEPGEVLTKQKAIEIEQAGVMKVVVRCEDGSDLFVISNGMVDPMALLPEGFTREELDEIAINEKVRFSVMREVLEKCGDDKQALLEEMRLRCDDLIPKHIIVDDIFASVNYVNCLTKKVGNIDDIDHLGNRRIRSVGELLQNQFRIGLARMERVVRERMAIQAQEDEDKITPQSLINIRPVMVAVREFFGSSPLSQFMDQHNPLAELTHKRRLSALGPGGLSRDRAGFEVRDVHYSHYGRMCPIETPEGPNIGLISYLATFAKINEYGFIEAPFRKIDKETGVVLDEVEYMTADTEDEYIVAQANEPLDENNRFVRKKITARHRDEFLEIDNTKADYMDVSPKMVVSVATALIPFLENDDANRALMGSNMQKQAVPLLKTEAPIVGTGMEYKAAVDSGSVVLAKEGGVVSKVAADSVDILEDGGTSRHYELIKFMRSNQGTCTNQRPIVSVGQRVEKDEVIADGPAIDHGELSLGKNALVGFMTWEGYNYEDAVLLNERLVRDDVYTSLHIEEYTHEARDTKLGPEEITREVPNVGDDVLKDLNADGIVKKGTEVRAGDILVGKITPKGETELTAEERLLRAIFGEKAREVRDTSLRLPHGESGVVVDVRVFSREQNDELPASVNKVVKVYIAQKRKISVGDKMAGRHGNKGVVSRILPPEDMPFLPDGTPLDIVLNPLGVPSRMNIGQVLEVHLGIAAKRLGWKIMTPVFDGANEKDISECLHMADYSRPLFAGENPEGKELFELVRPDEPHDIDVAPRHEGDARHCYRRLTPEQRADPAYIESLRQADTLRLFDGKTILYDGRTGEPFDNPVTVGIMYYLKLHHLVDDKIHARSNGPYSLVTQQPLGGKAQFGGQRFGEMEVWALEAYGAAYTLQEILTVKSDDINGRRKAYEAIIKGQNIPTPGVPESFKVMVKELQALALDIRVLNQNGEEVNLSALCNEDDQPAYRRRAPRTERDPDEEDIERATGQFVETGDLSDSYLVEKNEMNPEEEYSDETDYGAAEQDGDDLSDGYDE